MRQNALLNYGCFYTIIVAMNKIKMNIILTTVLVFAIGFPLSAHSATTYTLGMKVNNVANTVYAQDSGGWGGAGSTSSMVLVEVLA